MDIERHAISKVIEDGGIEIVLDNKITGEFFEDEDHRKVFEWSVEFWRAHGELPTARAVRHEFPDWTPCTATEPLTFYIEELRRARSYAILVTGIREAQEHLREGDTDAARNVLGHNLTKVNTEVSVLDDVDLNETLGEWLEAYRVEEPGLLGAPMGFPTLDMATGGMQAEQLITVVGPPKAGKSTLMMFSSLTANMYGWRPMFLSFEMSAEEQRQRAVSMLAGVDFQKLRQYRLNRNEMKLVEKALRQQSNLPPYILSTDITGAATVGQLDAKVAQYQPHVLFVDGVYLMQNEAGFPDGTPQALTSITRSMKRLAQRFKIPVVQSTQVLDSKYVRARGITANSIGYTGSFVQDSDVVIGIEWSTDEKKTNERRLSIVRARNTTQRQVLLDWNWKNSSFTEMTVDEDDESGQPPEDVNAY